MVRAVLPENDAKLTVMPSFLKLGQNIKISEGFVMAS